MALPRLTWIFLFHDTSPNTMLCRQKGARQAHKGYCRRVKAAQWSSRRAGSMLTPLKL